MAVLIGASITRSEVVVAIDTKNTFDSLQMQNFKIVMLGDMSVGKSSLIMRYVNGSFSETMTTTVGASH